MNKKILELLVPESQAEVNRPAPGRDRYLGRLAATRLVEYSGAILAGAGAALALTGNHEGSQALTEAGYAVIGTGVTATAGAVVAESVAHIQRQQEISAQQAAQPTTPEA